jgi:ATP-dependent Clp protease ATP-binding subunit ClpC
MTVGEEEAALAELRAFLTMQLATAEPADVTRVAAFSRESDTALRHVDVEVVVQDGAEPIHVEYACVALGANAPALARVPQRERKNAPPPAPFEVKPDVETWLAIPALSHVFRLPEELSVLDGEGVDALIRKEAQRILNATSKTSLDAIARLPPPRTTLARMTLQLARPEQASAEARQQGKQRAAEAQRRAELQAQLESMARRIGPSPAPIARESLVQRMRGLLASAERLSVLVRGAELVGKSSLIEHVLGAEARPAYALPVARFLAGDGGFGEWQSRVESVFRAAEVLDAILYIEDIGGLSLERAGSTVDIASAMAPFLESKKVRLVAEIRDDQLDRFDARQRGLSGAFVRVQVPAMTTAETTHVLVQRYGDAERAALEGHRALTPEACATASALVERYLPYRALPGEAVRVVRALQEALDVPRDAAGVYPLIQPAHITEAFAARTGLPSHLLRDDVALAPEEIAASLRARVIGQDEAVSAVAQALSVVKAGLQARGKPIASFLFAGPTGTGKTELARALASFLFGSADAFARFDMSEYMDAWSSERLIRGNDREDGLLTRRVRERPFSVLLLDEIEKAHPAVFDLLLQVLGEGRLTDARGKTAYFQNTIIVMTSNLGARADRPLLGFERQDASRRDVYLRAVREHFRPELLNRIDRVVPFASLTSGDALRIGRIFVRGILQRSGFTEARHAVHISDGALMHVVEGALTADGGARALRRNLEDALVVGLAKLLARMGSGEQAVIDVEPATSAHVASLRVVLHAGLAFVLRRKPTRGLSQDRAPLDRITALRRRLSRWVHLSQIESHRAEVARLTADVAKMKRRGEHHQFEQRLQYLGPVMAEIDRLYRELEAVEELALTALAREESLEELVTEAETLARTLENALHDVLRGGDDLEFSFVITAARGEGKGIALFLKPLLESVSGNEQNVSVYFPSGIGTPDATWPAARVWGPHRTPKESIRLLANSARFSRVYVSSEDVWFFLSYVHTLVRVRYEKHLYELVFHFGATWPGSDDAKFPDITGIPDRADLTIDLDAKRLHLDGADEPWTIPENGDWVSLLPSVAVAALALAEGA